MSSVLISQGLVLATAMAVSSTLLFLTFSRHKTLSPTHLSGDDHDKQRVLRSCLYSGDKKRERKKKKVQFAENVKEPNSNGEEFRKKQHKKRIRIETVSCRKEISTGSQGMPANRVALFNGILRDRVQRMTCSY